MAAKSNALRKERDKRQPEAVPSTASVGAQNLDRVIHDRMRLGILSALAVNDSLTFTEIKKLLDASDGNLSVHSRKLEEAGYLTFSKSFEGRVPKTEYRITAAGRKAFDRYLNHMESIIQAMRDR